MCEKFVIELVGLCACVWRSGEANELVGESDAEGEGEEDDG